MLAFRPATPSDRALLEGWDETPHVRAALGADDGWDWARELAEPGDWREMLIVELDGTPIAFLQIMDPAREPSRYWGEQPPGTRALDIWIGEAWALNRGHGTRIMGRALARCFADASVRTILIDPLEGNTGARRFYERLGFRPLGPRRLGGADGCIVYRLTRDDWETRRG